MNEDLAALYGDIVRRRISAYDFSPENLFDFRQALMFLNAQRDRPAKRSDALTAAVSTLTIFEAIYEQIHCDARREFDATVEDIRSAERATAGEGSNSGGGAGEL